MDHWTASKAQQDAEAALEYTTRQAEPEPSPPAPVRRRSIDALVEHFRKALADDDGDLAGASLEHIRRNTIYACAMLRADKLAGLPLRAYKLGKESGGRTVDLRQPLARLGMPMYARGRRVLDSGEVTRLETSPVLDLLTRPNDDWTGRQFLRVTEATLCIAAEAHWWFTAKSRNAPTEIRFVRPDATDAEVERIAYRHPTSHDMECLVTLQIEGVSWGINGTKSSRDILRKGGAEEMEDLSFEGLVDVIKTGGEQLFDQSQNYGMFIDTYELRYTYNHNSP